MKHEADIALALSEQGEKFFQSEAANYPALTEVIAEGGAICLNGSTIRYWEKVDYSGEFEKFITSVSEFQSSATDYHLVGISHYGGVWEEGAFVDPFGLHLHDYTEYEIEYNPSGQNTRSECKKTDAEVLFPAVFSANATAEKLVDPNALKGFLNEISLKASDSLSDYLKMNSEIAEFAAMPDNKGKDLLIRVFVRVEPGIV